ncbi:hypothetical protein NA56DRAFT_756272 [Hyaloscypha hepaticicola]|uniref:CHAT domain-containing protein n=1 Tax=Hyaloscypha hepaticicola TaxID=2082293 RepID=A0A2J6PFV1_9HELO|nr:hypothetical protein NA56DRAFT_756272 [Hyaloscypha hepaticicola]
MNLVKILNQRIHNINEIAQNIEMYEIFERKHQHKHPKITLPVVQEILAGLRKSLYPQHGEARSELGGLGSDIGTAYNLRRHISSTEPNEETLRFKDVIDEQDKADGEFDLLYGFFSQPIKVIVPKILHKLVTEESRSAMITEDSLTRIFGFGGNTKSTALDEFIKLDGQQMLQKLVGTAGSPVLRAEWLERRPVLKEWLLKASHPKLPLRQCLWECKQKVAKTVKAGSTRPNLITESDISSSQFFNTIHELVSAIEERVSLDEAKLGYGLDYFERQSQTTGSLRPMYYIGLFSSSRVSGQKPSATSLSYLKHAEDLAREYLAHWKSMKNYVYIAMMSINIATIAQYRIECGILTEVAVIKETLDEALRLLEEVEVLFGTTLCDVDLSHSLVSLKMKVYVGSRMDIWTVGDLALRLLLSASQSIQKMAGGVDDSASAADQQELAMRLWQWVQRGKARALAQGMDLENVVPDSLLIAIRDSMSKVRESRGSEDTDALETVRWQTTSAVPLELLSEVREFLKESNSAVPELPAKLSTQEAAHSTTQAKPRPTLEDAISLSRDFQSSKAIVEKIQNLEHTQTEVEKKLQEELAELSERIAANPELHTVLRIAGFLNREAELLHSIKSEALPEQFQERFQSRIDLQRLRQEMRSEPLLQEMLRIREGRPLSNDDLHKIAAGRNGKAVFVDWFSTTNSVDMKEKVYMIVWRNGDCKLIDLNTELEMPRRAINQFFNCKNTHLPDIRLTPLEAMDENMIPNRSNIEVDNQPVVDCMDLIRPLFDSSLVEPEDLLVLSVTEGFNNFPLHAIDDGELGPLILYHPVVYVPSLSVLHKYYWSQHSSSKAHKPSKEASPRSLVLGGIVSNKPKFGYGVPAVTKIGTLVNAQKTFAGSEATLANFHANVETAELLHIHLHTNYPVAKNDAASFVTDVKEDKEFTASPLNQAIMFNSAVPDSYHMLTAGEILELKLSRGAHLNLVACASGRQGMLESGFGGVSRRTDEVMGLVPAFLFAGVGSVGSSLWAIEDEVGGVFGVLVFGEIMREVERVKKGFVREGEGEGRRRWVDLAGAYRRAVLEMRRIYGAPSAWAAFVLSGYWEFEA